MKLTKEIRSGSLGMQYTLNFGNVIIWSARDEEHLEAGYQKIIEQSGDNPDGFVRFYDALPLMQQVKFSNIDKINNMAWEQFANKYGVQA